MTTELVTAHAGTNHVGSEDVGAMQAATLGAGRYAVELGDNLAVSMDDANTVRIGTGGFFLDGRFVRVSEAETVKVANGSQGAYRKDLVTYTYERDPSSGNVETGTWGVLQGTAASKESDARAPEFEAGNVLDGDLKATVAVAEVDLAGLTPTARLLLPSVASLKSLGESVYPRVLISERVQFSHGSFDFAVLAVPAVSLLIVKVNGSVSSDQAISEDVYMTGRVPQGYRPASSTAVALPTYEGSWGRFSARLSVMDDGRVRLTVQSPQAISTGYGAQSMLAYGV